MKVKVIRVTVKPTPVADEAIEHMIHEDEAICSDASTCCECESAIQLEALQIQYDAAKSRICKLESEIEEQKAINARLLEECKELHSKLNASNSEPRCSKVCQIPYRGGTVCAIIRKV